VFVVAYQNILKLTYIDKFLTEIQLRFRDKYKQLIQNGQFNHDFSGFRVDFDSILEECEKESKLAMMNTQKPRAYKESAKSTRTVSSMMETKKGILSSFMSSSTEVNNNATKEKLTQKTSKPIGNYLKKKFLKLIFLIC
jgi:hypothetical protein